MTALTQDTNSDAAQHRACVGQTQTLGGNGELPALVALCRCALTGDSYGLAEAVERVGSPEVFAALVDNARLWAACEAGFARAQVPAPPFVTERARTARAQAMLVNGRAMGLARVALPCLEQHHIPAIAFKGPFHQSQLYGDWFVRSSNDLDLLVPQPLFEKALSALESVGFRTRHGNSQWWKFSLGEVHCDYPGGGVVDLHHRLQQPGCPSPRDPAAFIEAAEIQQLGETAIPVPSLQHALLISALNFCKELFHRKPSARYAFDFAAGALRLSSDSRRDFAALVRQQGLEGPVNFTIAACERVFGPLPGLNADTARRSVAAEWAQHGQFARLVFTPDAPGLRWPRRRALLWQFCGGEPSARCSFDFAAQAGRIALGEVLRSAAPQDAAHAVS
ncbi:nucleotidyltransferase family protein [Erythrobacter sp. NFXS35]|uniref:nucleotidyltransferase family protein n=1 Tax=Erythrobacter sp. NFXS35 TaxID=2818436 RepID=UPI0032DE3BD3